jgi:type I restriction enzyme M protein
VQHPGYNIGLPESARFDVILKTPKDGNLGAALNAAMEAIEAAFPSLAGQLPKDYARFRGRRPRRDDAHP